MGNVGEDVIIMRRRNGPFYEWNGFHFFSFLPVFFFGAAFLFFFWFFLVSFTKILRTLYVQRHFRTSLFLPYFFL